MILCDASALVALISQDDNNHDRFKLNSIEMERFLRK